jgi:hypothetical protein
MSTHSHADPDASPDQDDESADAATLEKDLVFELLKNQRRRRVIEHVRSHDGVTLGQLAEAIAAVENDTSVAALSADERKRVYIGLYQTHLPKMDDAGVIVYDRDAGAVSPGPAMDQIAPYLETGSDDASTAESEPTRAEGALSALGDPVTLPGWALLAALLLVGLVAVAATALPGPVWAGVLAVSAVVATLAARWT